MSSSLSMVFQVRDKNARIVHWAKLPEEKACLLAGRKGTPTIQGTPWIALKVVDGVVGAFIQDR